MYPTRIRATSFVGSQTSLERQARHQGQPDDIMWTAQNDSFSLLNLSIRKYPRTPHLEGSRLQDGDEGHEHVPFSSLQGQYVVIEEKLDGGNCAISFSEGGELLLQSRGHYLTGGGRERQFALFKRWAQCHEAVFLERLEDRFIMYGEWLHKLHAVPYDALPHYFTEFDVWDRKEERFLSTASRQALLAGLPVLSVPVLFEGVVTPEMRLKDLTALVRPSLAKTPAWKEAYILAAQRAGVSEAQAWAMADKSDFSEGLYLKVETEAETVGRLKWVRPDFVQAIQDSGKHHSEQPFVANGLCAEADIFSPELTACWPVKGKGG